MPDYNTDAEKAIVDRARQLLATYEDMAELIRLGAYRQGSDAQVDEAIVYFPAIEAFLAQAKGERADLVGGYDRLAEILGMPLPSAPPAEAPPVDTPPADTPPPPGAPPAAEGA